MHHDEFIGQVQHAAQLPSRGDAERVTRVVLETLGERLTEEMAHHLAAQLPSEIGRHLIGRVASERMTLDQFHQRIELRERTTATLARRHVDAVLGIVAGAVSPGVIRHILNQLPSGFGAVFFATGSKEIGSAAAH